MRTRRIEATSSLRPHFASHKPLLTSSITCSITSLTTQSRRLTTTQTSSLRIVQRCLERTSLQLTSPTKFTKPLRHLTSNASSATKPLNSLNLHHDPLARQEVRILYDERLGSTHITFQVDVQLPLIVQRGAVQAYGLWNPLNTLLTRSAKRVGALQLLERQHKPSLRPLTGQFENHASLDAQLLPSFGPLKKRFENLFSLRRISLKKTHRCQTS